MLTRLLARLLGPAPAAPARQPLPEAIDLEPGGEVRLIYPRVPDGYAALINSEQGFFIFNQFDGGVGWQLRTHNAYDAEQMRNLEALARGAPADPVILDIGANIGVATLIFARVAGARGLVHAFEPQRVLFHMLAGNLALNSVDNVHCYHLAVGSAPGTARLPRLDYRRPASFGSVELNREQQSDSYQQAQDGLFDGVPMTSVDALELPRVDLIKIDVEGMEQEVLGGAMATIRAQRPLLYVEYLKSDKQAMWRILHEEGYLLYDADNNFVCIPTEHPARARLTATLAPWSPARG